MSRIRIKYEKGQLVKYLGHLDTITMFDRAFRRSNISIKFSQGFNQRACFVFALPTSTGIESKCEYLEVDVVDENIDIKGIMDRLNKVLPDGFKIIEITVINDNKSIMAKVIESEYKINIQIDDKNLKSCINMINNIFNSDSVEVIKKRKAKEKIDKAIDIKPYVLYFNVYSENDDIVISLRAKAGSKENLRVDYIIQVIENAGIDIEDYSILRTNLILKE